MTHSADMCADMAGLPREEAKDAIFWDVFEVRNPVTGELAEPWIPCEAAAGKGQKFVLHKVRRCGDPADEPCQFTMRFRCADLPHSTRVSCGYLCFVGQCKGIGPVFKAATSSLWVGAKALDPRQDS